MLRQILIALLILFSLCAIILYKDNKIKHLENELQAATTQGYETALKLSQDLNEYKAKADKEKKDEIEKVSASYQRTIDSLRNRPVRPSKPDNSSTVASCTGAQLYREDGEFLAGEAARAEKVRIERDYYYDQYERVRRTLSGQEQDGGLDGKVSNPRSVP